MAEHAFKVKTPVPKGARQIYCRVNDEIWEMISRMAKEAHC